MVFKLAQPGTRVCMRRVSSDRFHIWPHSLIPTSFSSFPLHPYSIRAIMDRIDWNRLKTGEVNLGVCTLDAFWNVC